MSSQHASTVSVVLVVEDNELVCMYAAEMLEDAGLTVLVAHDADEAWDILEERDDIDALFTDIDMPGSMNGLTLAEKVAERWPTVRLVLTSGHHQLAARQVPEHGRFVLKPYQSSQVLAAIGNVV